MLYIIGVFYQNVYTSSINRYKSNTKFKKLQKTWGSCEAFLLIKREAGGFRILALRVAKSPSRSTLVIRSDRLKTFLTFFTAQVRFRSFILYRKNIIKLYDYLITESGYWLIWVKMILNNLVKKLSHRYPLRNLLMNIISLTPGRQGSG